MKQLILTFCLILGLQASAVEVTVDENVEFVSAMCRLADFDEYVYNLNKDYAKAIDSVMAPLKNHKAVARLKELRREQGVSYDAVANFTAQTAISNGHFVLLPGSDVSKSEDRWRKGQDAKMAKLLDDAYRHSGFHQFFLSQQPFYSKVVNNAKSIIEKVDLKWLEDFYGTPIQGRVSISLLNRGNYGTTQHCDGKPEESVIIIGCSDLDSAGIPVFHNIKSLIVHEFSHPSCNPIIDKCLPQFNDNAQRTAQLMESELHTRNYAGGNTVLYESLVRAVETQYAMAHATTANDSIMAASDIKTQVAGGFLFFRELTNALTNYRQNRSKYATLVQFAPKIVEAVNGADIEKNYQELRINQIKIVGTSMPLDARDVPASDRYEIKVYFDKPYTTGGFAYDYYNDNEDILPDLIDLKMSEDRRVMSMFIQTEPGHEYGFVLPGWAFKTEAGYPGAGNTVVHFFTAK